jgi:hypothetical protein
MSRKLALSLLLIVLGLATFDALDGVDWREDAAIAEEGQVQAKFDGVGAPPPDGR